MIAGPYRHGSQDPEQWQQNLQVMNEVAYRVFLKGHIPLIGVNMALPVIDVAGEDHYEALMMPISLALAERCEAILRIGGPSNGADREVEKFSSKGLPVYYTLEEIP